MGTLTNHTGHIYPRRSRLILARVLLFLVRGLDPISIRLSRRIFSTFLGDILLIISTPRELEELVKFFYARPQSVKNWGEIFVGPNGELTDEEAAFVVNYLGGKKKCLVFQSGGGRESIALAQKGFEVTGVDACDALLKQARKRAADMSLPCRFEIGDMFDGPGEKRKYDALFLTQIMYSGIPTRGRRIAFLTTARTLLADGGFFYLEFQDDSGLQTVGWKFRIKRCLARLCDGNLELEIGDVYLNDHFWHGFKDESELVSEFQSAGFAVAEVKLDEGYAVLTLPGSGPG